MERILKKQLEKFLVGCAMFFLVVIIGFFVWGIGFLIVNVNQAFGSSSKGIMGTEFRIEDAKKILQLRGLL